MSALIDIDDLRHRHHSLDGQIEDENALLPPDELKISALKKEKLVIKDLIQQLEVNS